MTDELRKLVLSKRRVPTPLTPAQEARIDCALNLYRLAASIACLRGTPSDDRIRLICTPGALAEAYAANIAWLNELLGEKLGRSDVSADETVAAWRALYEWLVRDGIRPPIVQWDGVKYAPLPFEAVHDHAVNAYRDIKSYRKEVVRK